MAYIENIKQRDKRFQSKRKTNKKIKKQPNISKQQQQQQSICQILLNTQFIA